MINKIMWCYSCDDARMADDNEYCPKCSDKLKEIGWMNNEEM